VIDFPNAPTVGQVFQNWQWDGAKWGPIPGGSGGGGGGVTSFNTRTGVVTMVAADVTGVGGALLANPHFASGVFETRIAVAASAIDLNTGTFFTKTAAANLTWTVTNVPASNTVGNFILELTNGGAYTMTWWANMRWAGGTAPKLTAAGRDSLGFYTLDGGANWNGLVLGQAMA
jgi:hypothetical protein